MEATALRGKSDIMVTINQDNRYVRLLGGQGCQGVGSLCVNTMIDLTIATKVMSINENRTATPYPCERKTRRNRRIDIIQGSCDQNPSLTGHRAWVQLR